MRAAAIFSSLLLLSCRFDGRGLAGPRPEEGTTADRSASPSAEARPRDLALPDRPDGSSRLEGGAADVRFLEAMPCPKGCGGCPQGVCVHDCGPAGCTCPAPKGMRCRLVCPAGGCKGKVDCGNATGCQVDCSAPGSCTGEVACGAGACAVTCGSSSCGGKVSCSNATTCDIDCGLASGLACFGDILCGSGACTVNCGLNSCTQKIVCGAGACNVNCGLAAGGSCVGDVVCGTAACTVNCGSGACKSKIDCTQSDRCEIQCNAGACLDLISCGSGSCAVTCALGSCLAGVDCSKSCACSVQGSSGKVSCPPPCQNACAPSDGCDNC